MFGVTILIPTFNRAKFSKLIVHNINCQTYPCIEKIIVADDGDEHLDLSGCKYDIEYIENWSLYLDFKIIIKTPFAIFSKKIKGM